ncbi:UDP-N-acetylmuramate dehydrogenase [Candidatus Nomurabacteria bacterium]|nr:UDP-N-acetylmuramate dehydrogenase [Candidatus Nomurabacteria bacterium]
MKIKQNYNLSKLNTFGVDVNAKFFVEVKKEEEIAELFSLPEFKDNKKIFLGGGSNVLFTKDFDGIVILNKLKGIEILEQDEETVTVRAMGGEVWHDLVVFAVNRGYWGIENLSLIPGTVGAAPMQNIGAYGVELKNTLVSVEAYELETGIKKIFSGEECELGYRDSIFKNKLKEKYFISAITLKLSKIPQPNLSYKILREFLEKPARNASHSDAGGNNIQARNPKDISDAVAEIRRSKLPDPKIVGNAGSFFKNVFVTKEQLQKLQESYPDISYFEEDGAFKIPAGWLIEHAGWKGKREGRVGVHDKQALVLVNHGEATGAEIIELANKIIKCVKDKFDLTLAPEVNIV